MMIVNMMNTAVNNAQVFKLEKHMIISSSPHLLKNMYLLNIVNSHLKKRKKKLKIPAVHCRHIGKQISHMYLFLYILSNFIHKQSHHI